MTDDIQGYRFLIREKVMTCINFELRDKRHEYIRKGWRNVILLEGEI